MRQITENKELCDLLTQKIKAHPLFCEKNKIYVNEKGYVLEFGYKPTPKGRKTTKFEAQIVWQKCHIIEFEIEKKQRRKGLGSKLYQIIEDFVKEQRCEKIIVGALGQGQRFWPEMGFELIKKGTVVDTYHKKI